MNGQMDITGLDGHVANVRFRSLEYAFGVIDALATFDCIDSKEHMRLVDLLQEMEKEENRRREHQARRLADRLGDGKKATIVLPWADLVDLKLLIERLRGYSELHRPGGCAFDEDVFENDRQLQVVEKLIGALK